MSEVAVRRLATVTDGVPSIERAALRAPVLARSATAITLTWLVRLRWGFCVAQAVTIAGARYVLDVNVPIAPLAVVVAASGLSNLALGLWSRKARDPHVRVLIIDSEVSATQERDARAATERNLPAIVLDPGAKLADAVDAEYATCAVVFDATGRLRYRGGIDTDKNVLHDDSKRFLRDALDDLLAGRDPRNAEGKALGCALQKR